LSISSSDRIAGPFSSGTVLPFEFKVFQTSDVRVVKTLADGTVLPDLTAPTDYSVSLNADQDVDPGGEVTLTVAISGGDSVVVTSIVPNTQPTTITNLGGFLPSTLNTAFDRGVIQMQQVSSKVEASIQFPVSDANANNPVLPPAAVRANKYLAFDASGDPLVTEGAASGTPVSVYGGELVQATDSADARSILEIAQVPFTPASASAPASLRFAEDTDNGSHYLDLTAPAALAFSATCTLPFAGGTLVSEDNSVSLSNKKLVLSAGTTSLAPIKLASGTNLTTATAGSTEYDGKVQYFTPLGTQRGIIPALQQCVQDSTVVGANGTGAQNIFTPANGVTLSGSTYYEFEGVFYFSKIAGTTPHNFNLLFGGTATLNNISYKNTTSLSTVGFTSITAAPAEIFVQTASATAAISPSTAGAYVMVKVSGFVSVDAGGTFNPQYQLSAAPGGAYTTAIGSSFKIWPIGASGSNVVVGAWP
jgi:hypothetical protein